MQPDDCQSVIKRQHNYEVETYTLRSIGENADGEEECPGVLDMGVLVCDKHDETDDSNQIEANHEDSTSSQLIGKVTTIDAAKDCGDVRWN